MGTLFDYTGKLIEKKYAVDRSIGQGGMAAVYLAEHTLIRKKVAIKILNTRFVDDPEAVRRFYREARAASAIGHPNIIDVLDVGVTEHGEPFLVMEYLEGVSLGDLIQRNGAIDFPAACAIVEPVLNALSAVHAKGIIHRDLKPDNIFIAARNNDEYLVKLIDFGVSKFVEADEGTALTETGSLLGTPAYMAPEQIIGSKDVTPSSDIYTLGIILYEMLTGQLPYEAKTSTQVMVEILHGEPLEARLRQSDLPLDALPLLAKSTHRDASKRYQSANEMLNELKATKNFSERRAHLLRASSQSWPDHHSATGYLGQDARVDSRHPVTDPSSVLQNLAASYSPPAKRSRGLSKRTLMIAVGILSSALLAAIAAALVLYLRGN